LIVGGVAVGFFIIPFAARIAPVLVNSLLFLTLIGALLLNSERWLPYLAGFSGATSKATGKGTTETQAADRSR
jgi:hypothetical protein